MHVLWKNHIPMCIEVLLYEDCAHGAEKAAAVDVAMPSSADNYVLLEQWTVQIVPRRSGPGGGISVSHTTIAYQATSLFLYIAVSFETVALKHFAKTALTHTMQCLPPSTSSGRPQWGWKTRPSDCTARICCRGVEGAVRPRELFQAIKSYLHFSQLSAWLNLTRGKTPRNVGYRCVRWDTTQRGGRMGYDFTGSFELPEMFWLQNLAPGRVLYQRLQGDAAVAHLPRLRPLRQRRRRPRHHGLPPASP